MSIEASQLRTLVIRPTLEYLGLWSQSAENLLMGTAAQESHLGSYIKQVEGPALGIYQMEPATQRDIWENYLMHKRDLHSKVSKLSAPVFFNKNDNQIIWNLAYATAMSRIHYLRVPESLPSADNIVELGSYWKSYYNTPRGKGTVEEFVKNYGRFVDDLPIKTIH